MMKQKILIMSIIILLAISLYSVFIFHEIESTNMPYMSKLEQVNEFFEQNKTILSNIANAFQGYDYKYVYIESTKGREQLSSKLEDTKETEQQKLAEQIWSLYEASWVNLYEKRNGVLYIGQVYPIYGSDCIVIGVTYDYETKLWETHYSHGYERCDHTHKFFYRLYDFMFNRK